MIHGIARTAVHQEVTALGCKALDLDRTFDIRPAPAKVNGKGVALAGVVELRRIPDNHFPRGIIDKDDIAAKEIISEETIFRPPEFLVELAQIGKVDAVSRRLEAGQFKSY